MFRARLGHDYRMRGKILDYERTLAELLGLIRQLVAVFAGTSSTPPVAIAIIEGVRERGGESPGM